MSPAHLLLLAASASAAAQTKLPIYGGGAASQQFDYAAPDVNGVPISEMSIFNTGKQGAAFSTYWSTTSGAAQAGLLNNDLTCIINKSLNINGGVCSGDVGGSDTVHYAISESVLTPAQIADWASSSVGQAAAGNLIQIPAMGTGLAIVVNDPGVTANGQVTFSDNDLCEMFSGGYTDFSQITDSATAPAAGTIKLVYRSDSAGTTYLLTNHLSAVCTAANTAPGVTFIATSTFAGLFGNITAQLPNGYPVSGLSNLANTLAGLVSPGALTQAVAYISPDWTSVDSATSSAKLSNGNPSKLVVAGLMNGDTAYTPTAANISLALKYPRQGSPLTPPLNATAGAMPGSWVPVIQTVSQGYPIVGYSTIDLPQCYASPVVAAAMKRFLLDHYDGLGYRRIQANNGLVPVANGTGARFLKAIRFDILNNVNGWNINIGNSMGCASVVGR